MHLMFTEDKVSSSRSEQTFDHQDRCTDRVIATVATVWLLLEW